jgi:hypothetical protein
MNRLTGENLLETKGGHRECPIPLNVESSVVLPFGLGVNNSSASEELAAFLESLGCSTKLGSCGVVSHWQSSK